MVLNQCNLDKQDGRAGSAFLREWGIFAVRNLCEGNEVTWNTGSAGGVGRGFGRGRLFQDILMHVFFEF